MDTGTSFPTCSCKKESCNPGQVCFLHDNDDSSCLNYCPSRYFTAAGTVTVQDKPCFCNTTTDKCETNELCGSDGCLEACPTKTVIEDTTGMYSVKMEKTNISNFLKVFIEVVLPKRVQYPKL